MTKTTPQKETSRGEVAPIQKLVDTLLCCLAEQVEPKTADLDWSVVEHPEGKPDEEIIDELQGDSQSAALWSGDTSAYGNDRSSADLALVSRIARRAGPHPAIVDRLMKKSGLYRPKWERDDYKQRTISRALESAEPKGRSANSRSLEKTSPKPNVKSDRVKRSDKAKEHESRSFVGGSPEFELYSLDTIVARPIDWLWDSWFARGKVTLVVGHPGSGKTFLMCDLAARVSTGGDWPDGAAGTPGRVLILNAEDGPDDTILPRLEAAGADCSRVHMIQPAVDPQTGRRTSRLFRLNELEQLLEGYNNAQELRLLTIDPFGSYLGPGTDQNSENSVRELLAPLKELAEKYGLAVIVIAHTRKMEAERADDMVMGSRAHTGFARAVFHLFVDPKDSSRRLLVPGKFNLGDPPPGLAFTFNAVAPGALPPTLHWDSTPLDQTADDVLAELKKQQRAQLRRPSAIEVAKNWLEAKLADGPRQSAELRDEAIAADISVSTYNRACRELGVQHEQRERVWWTSLSTPIDQTTGSDDQQALS